MFHTSRGRNLVAALAILLTTMMFTTLFTLTQSMSRNLVEMTFRQTGSDAEATIRGLTDEEADDLAAARAGIRATVDWFAGLGLPTSLPQLLGRGPLPEGTLRELAEGVTYQGKRKVGSFLVLGQPEILEIYRLANR